MAYNEQSITVELTLPILTKLGNFISEFDCKVNFACWENDRDEWDWEPREVTMEGCSFYAEHSFTKQTDPVMWEVILRALGKEDSYVAERLIERLLQDAA